MEIGQPRRTYTAEPLEDPGPRERLQGPPKREEPVGLPREAERVP